LIALLLGLFFTAVALLNAWRRKRRITPPAPGAGPILMSDPHSGMPVSTRLSAENAPLEKPPLPPLESPGKQAPEPKPEAAPLPAATGAQYFRQLDARGVDVAVQGEKNDDYQWE
jgi:hypothetical protein